MNKKLFSIIALGASVTGALATGALGDTIEFVRTSSTSAKSAIPQTQTARNTPLHHGADKHIDAASPDYVTALADGPLTLIDNLPAYGDEISKYEVLDVNNDRTWDIGKHTYDQYSYFEISPNKADLDDWLFFPIDVPEDGGRLSLSMLAVTSYSDGHTLKAYIGDSATPEAMTLEIAGAENFGTGSLTWTYATTISGSAKMSAGGSRWLGIHATSAQTAYKLRLRNVTLTCEAAGQPAPAGEVFSMHPTEQEFGNCTILDGNADGCKIKFDVHQGSAGETYDWPIYYNKDGSAPVATADADEWIVSPAVNLTETDRLYTAAIEAQTMSTGQTEAFQLVLAKSNDLAGVRAGKVIMNEPVVTNTDYKQFESRFGVSQPGTYYFAVHINSSLDRGWRIALRNLVVSLTDNSSKIPESVSGLTLTADAAGALQANVSFVMPTTYINGSTIASGETVDAKIVTPAQTVTVSGQPGQSIQRTVATSDGTNIVTVTTSNANGEGMEAKDAVVCGPDTPTDPVVTSVVSDDNMELNLTWQPVTEGANGGIVPQDGLEYNIYTYSQTSEMGQWVLLESGIKECKYTLRAKSDTQTLYQLMVSARNTRGESLGSIKSYASATLGKPHQLPVNETFEGQSMMFDGLLIDYPTENYTAQWALDAPSAVGAAGGPDYALMCLVAEIGNEGYGYAELPKFSTVGCTKPRFKLLTYICDATPTTILRIHSTEGRGNGEQLGVIDSNSGEGWCELTFEIPARYYNKGWAVISADVLCEYAGQVFVLGPYDIYESVGNDLAINRASVPSYIRLGEEAPFSVSVQNIGYNPAKTPEVKAEMLADGQLVAKPELSYTSATLAEGDRAEYTGRLSFDNLDRAGQDYILKFSLPQSDDNNNNNITTAEFRVGAGNMPIAADLSLKGTENQQGILLNWTNPYANGLVDYIESYEHGNHDYILGDWKNVDCDLASTYYSEGFDIPDAGQPKAFQSVNAMLSGMDGMNQPSGDSFLMAFCPEGATADDWLISPEVKSGSIVEFYLTSLSSFYPESVEILTSSTDDELDSFNNVLATLNVSESGWRLVRVTLPADAKYFAIHYVSNDQFGICIDDITCSPVAPSVEITGWNIYRDGTLIKENVKDCNYSDLFSVDVDKTYRYNVAAVGTVGGKSMVFPKSATRELCYAGIDDVITDLGCTIAAENGEITVDGCNGSTVEIVDVRGIKLFGVTDAPDHVSATVLPGIYVVTVDGRSCKVIVR